MKTNHCRDNLTLSLQNVIDKLFSYNIPDTCTVYDSIMRFDNYVVHTYTSVITQREAQYHQILTRNPACQYSTIWIQHQ